MTTAIQYLRRSTADKGQDLSFDRQQMIINDFCQREGITIVRTFVETASGAKDDRKVLAECLADAKKSGLPIVVSSISRLSRSVSFGSALLEDSQLTFIIAELGMKADSFLLNVLLCVAAKERSVLSTRVKSGLKLRAAAGVKLGNPNWKPAIQAANKVRFDNARRNQEKYYKAIKMIQTSGITSYNGIARQMNELGMKSPRGKSISPNYVRNLIRA